MSAAFKNAKKKLSQHDLRKLMNEQKGRMKKEIQKISSPLAKYTENGQLMCILCKSIVRSESVWSVHINAKQHKENVAEAKRLKDLVSSGTSKRQLSPEPNQPSKKIKGILKNSSQSNETNASSIPEDFFDSKKPIIQPVNFKLPNSKTHQNEAMEVDTSNNQNTEILPEGFFDDPKQDAKARNLEYKNPIEEEWERFQREMKDVNSVSDTIIAEDQEEATTERQIDEIDEQIRNWARVLDLERKKENLKKLAQEEANRRQAEESDDDDADFDEYLDWRSKNSFK